MVNEGAECWLFFSVQWICDGFKYERKIDGTGAGAEGSLRLIVIYDTNYSIARGGCSRCRVTSITLARITCACLPTTFVSLPIIHRKCLSSAQRKLADGCRMIVNDFAC